MEATGVYWIPVFEILEARGFQVILVNARHVKNVPGRKSDVSDCEWLRDLHILGLLRGSFRPADAIVALRGYLRHRATLIESAATHVQRMQKALVQMNVQLPLVVSDITGVTGLRILRDIVAGHRNPQHLARHRDPRCHASEADIAAALTGNYRPEHVFVLQQNLELFDAFQRQLAACDAAIEAHLTQLARPSLAPPATPLPPARPRQKPREQRTPLRPPDPAAPPHRRRPLPDRRHRPLQRPAPHRGDRHRHGPMADRTALHVVAHLGSPQQGLRRAAPQQSHPAVREPRRRHLPSRRDDPRPDPDRPWRLLSPPRLPRRQGQSHHRDRAQTRGAGLSHAQGWLVLRRPRRRAYDRQHRTMSFADCASVRPPWDSSSSIARPARSSGSQFLRSHAPHATAPRLLHRDARGTRGPAAACRRAVAGRQAPSKPDFVVFLADDHGFGDSTVYGATDVRTPSMQRLAAEGMTFTEAFVASPSCAPSRAALLTGLMPARNGAEANHTYKRDGVRSLTEDLKELGYQVAAFGKVAHGHDGPRHGFDVLEKRYDAQTVSAFLDRRDASVPLVLFVGTNEPHVPWAEPPAYDPAAISVPPTLIDTPQTRHQRARYLTDVTQADTELGEVFDVGQPSSPPGRALSLRERQRRPVSVRQVEPVRRRDQKPPDRGMAGCREAGLDVRRDGELGRHPADADRGRWRPGPRRHRRPVVRRSAPRSDDPPPRRGVRDAQRGRGQQRLPHARRADAPVQADPQPVSAVRPHHEHRPGRRERPGPALLRGVGGCGRARRGRRTDPAPLPQAPARGVLRRARRPLRVAQPGRGPEAPGRIRGCGGSWRTG